eukprot:gene6516-4693_t
MRTRDKQDEIPAEAAPPLSHPVRIYSFIYLFIHIYLFIFIFFFLVPLPSQLKSCLSLLSLWSSEQAMQQPYPPRYPPQYRPAGGRGGPHRNRGGFVSRRRPPPPPHARGGGGGDFHSDLDRGVRRHEECPSAYRVYLLPPQPPSAALAEVDGSEEVDTGAAAAALSGPSRAFTREEARRCAAVLGAPDFPDAVLSAPRAKEGEGEGEAPLTVRRRLEEAVEADLAPDAVVLAWRDTTLWEISHAALRMLRQRVDDAAPLPSTTTASQPPSTPPLTPATAATEGKEDEDNTKDEASAPAPVAPAPAPQVRYVLRWWVGTLSPHTGTGTFHFVGEVCCAQCLPDCPVLTPVRASAHARVLHEVAGFPGPGAPLFLSCERFVMPVAMRNPTRHSRNCMQSYPFIYIENSVGTHSTNAAHSYNTFAAFLPLQTAVSRIRHKPIRCYYYLFGNPLLFDTPDVVTPRYSPTTPLIIIFSHMSQSSAATRRMMGSATNPLSGFLEFRGDPPRLITTLKTFRHPETGKTVALHPLLSTALPSYLRRVYTAPLELQQRFDKILCEDGQLPLKDGTPAAARQKMWQRLCPFMSLKLVVPESDGAFYDGLPQRDAVETRMAYQMLQERWDPPVDPRARRAMERIATYPDGTRVCLPWGMYHLRYLEYRLQLEGYKLVESEYLVAIRLRLFIWLTLFVMFGSVVLLFQTIAGVCVCMCVNGDGEMRPMCGKAVVVVECSAEEGERGRTIEDKERGRWGEGERERRAVVGGGQTPGHTHTHTYPIRNPMLSLGCGCGLAIYMFLPFRKVHHPFRTTTTTTTINNNNNNSSEGLVCTMGGWRSSLFCWFAPCNSIFSFSPRFFFFPPCIRTTGPVVCRLLETPLPTTPPLHPSSSRYLPGLLWYSTERKGVYSTVRHTLQSLALSSSLSTSVSTPPPLYLEGGGLLSPHTRVHFIIIILFYFFDFFTSVQSVREERKLIRYIYILLLFIYLFIYFLFIIDLLFFRTRHLPYNTADKPPKAQLKGRAICTTLYCTFTFYYFNFFFLFPLSFVFLSELC